MRPGLWNIFGIFAKIGTFTIGGGYAMIPVIESEMQRRHWLEGKELEDVVILAQSAPGLLAVNMAIFTGYKLRGIKGSIVATLGAIMPSFVIILAIAAVFTNFKDNPVVIRIFQGIRPVAVALIAVPAVRMMRSGCKKWWAWALTLATLVLVAFLKISPIYILLVIIIAAAGIGIYRQNRKV